MASVKGSTGVRGRREHICQTSGIVRLLFSWDGLSFPLKFNNIIVIIQCIDIATAGNVKTKSPLLQVCTTFSSTSFSGIANSRPCSSQTFKIAGRTTILSPETLSVTHLNLNKHGCENNQIPRSAADLEMVARCRRRSSFVNCGLLYGSNALVKPSANFIMFSLGRAGG